MVFFTEGSDHCQGGIISDRIISFSFITRPAEQKSTLTPNSLVFFRRIKTKESRTEAVIIAGVGVKKLRSLEFNWLFVVIRTIDMCYRWQVIYLFMHIPWLS